MKILIIEDDKFFREFYGHKLREKNVEVDLAADGEEGLRKIEEFKPDIVLLDLIMPNKDGFEVLKDMAERNLTSLIPVLVFSTLAQPADIEKIKQLGAKEYVDKSFFDFDKLFARITELNNSKQPASS